MMGRGREAVVHEVLGWRGSRVEPSGGGACCEGGSRLGRKKAKMRFINGMVLSRPEYTSMFVYFFSFIFHPARVLFGSAR